MDFIKCGDASFFISYVFVFAFVVAFVVAFAFFWTTVFPMRIGSNGMNLVFLVLNICLYYLNRAIKKYFFVFGFVWFFCLILVITSHHITSHHMVILLAHKLLAHKLLAHKLLAHKLLAHKLFSPPRSMRGGGAE
jgi:hypothetical protein